MTVRTNFGNQYGTPGWWYPEDAVAMAEAINAVEVEAGAVHLTGDETIAGTKTFTSSPIVPTPGSTTAAANKDYVDTAVAGVQAGTVADNSITNAKMADNSVGTAEIIDGSVGIAELSATGTKNNTTVLYGDNVFRAAPVGEGAGLPAGMIDVVNDYGADPTGAGDSSAAFRDAFNAVIDSRVATYGLDPRAQMCIVVPPGTYKINSPEYFMPPNRPALGNRTAGVTWIGGGAESTMIVANFASGALCNNQDDYRHLTFRDLSFWSVNANNDFMTSDSDGGAQNYVFDRCGWGGSWRYGINMTGSNNNSEMTFIHPDVYGDWTAFLYNGASDTSDQFLNYTFIAPQFEMTTGDAVSLARGGNINVFGGSLIHAGNGNETTSAAQCFFKLGQGVTGWHGSGVMRLLVQGSRIEHRHNNSQLIKCQWPRGEVTFDSIDTECTQPLLATPDSVVQAEFNPDTGYYPIIEFANSSLMGKHKYHFNGSSYGSPDPSISYRKCDFSGRTRAADFLIFTNDDSTGNTAGKPPVRFHGGCRGDIAVMHRLDVFDCTVGFPAVMGASVQERVLSLQMPWGGLPLTGNTTLTAKLPLDAVITRIRCWKASGGNSTATNFTYTLTDANNATIATVTGGGAQWNTAWAWDSGESVFRRCTTDNARTLTLTSANISETSTSHFFLIDYLA